MITLISLGGGGDDARPGPAKPKMMWKKLMENSYYCEWHLTKLEVSTPKKRTPGSYGKLSKPFKRKIAIIFLHIFIHLFKHDLGTH